MPANHPPLRRTISLSRRTFAGAMGTLGGALVAGSRAWAAGPGAGIAFTGPIPTGPDSVSWGSAMDGGAREAAMRHYDYVEEEYFVSGACNVYGPGAVLPADATPSPMEYPDFVKPLAALVRSNVPYTTRATFLRPRDMGRFSGVVHMIPLHNLDGTSYVEKNLLRRGDVWIGLEVCGGTRFGLEERPSGGVANLLRFNPQRYAGLSLPSGEPGDWPDLQPGRLGEAFRNLDFGKREGGGHSQAHAIFRQEISRSYAQGPDIMTDAAAHIRRGGKGTSLSGHKVRWIFASGRSGQSTILQPYVDYHHAAATARLGHVPYDGYMIRVGSMPQSRPAGSVLVLVQSEAEALDLSADYIERFADSDDPKFRYYEIPGVGHGLTARPNVANIIGGVVPEGVAGISDIAGETHYEPYDKISLPVIWQMWANMVDWLEKGVAMPRAPRIERGPGGLARDEYGNARGGIRLPWMDHPDARYVGVISQKNPLEGGMMRFSQERMRELYGSDEAWRGALLASLAQLAKQRWIAQEDMALMLERGVTPALALGFVEREGD